MKFGKFKKGGGGKLQEYIPQGHGEKSGEYTSNSSLNNSFNYDKSPKKFLHWNNYKNIYNIACSKLVRNVSSIFEINSDETLPLTNKPDSVVKKTLGIERESLVIQLPR